MYEIDLYIQQFSIDLALKIELSHEANDKHCANNFLDHLVTPR
jgi:hypothetical protein